MAFKMKGFSGFKSSPTKHTTKKTHFHDEEGNVMIEKYQKGIIWDPKDAEKYEHVKVDPNVELPDKVSLEKHTPK